MMMIFKDPATSGPEGYRIYENPGFFVYICSTHLAYDYVPSALKEDLTINEK